LVASDDIMVALVKGFKEEKYETSDWNLKYLFPALRRLSINDHNKVQLVKNGIASIWVSKIGKEMNDERTLKEMLEMMLNLSFMEENRELLNAAKVPEALMTLQGLPRVKNMVEQILWKLNVLSPEIKTPTTALIPGTPSQGSAVMLSYNWDNQKVVVEIADRLKKDGFKVWLDLDEMSGSTLEAMANAVESSSIVLVCMSRKYKESSNCRLEGEYAFRKNKVIIPLMMQDQWEPDGWLGAIAGTKLYFPFFDPTKFPTSIEGVLKELRKHSLQQPNKSSPPTTSLTPTTAAESKEDPKSWNTTQVSDWLKQIGMEAYLIEKFLNQKINGNSLAGLTLVFQKSPEWVLTAIQSGGSLGFLTHGEGLQFLFQMQLLFQ